MTLRRRGWHRAQRSARALCEPAFTCLNAGPGHCEERGRSCPPRQKRALQSILLRQRRCSSTRPSPATADLPDSATTSRGRGDVREPPLPSQQGREGKKAERHTALGEPQRRRSVSTNDPAALSDVDPGAWNAGIGPRPDPLKRPSDPGVQAPGQMETFRWSSRRHDRGPDRSFPTGALVPRSDEATRTRPGDQASMSRCGKGDDRCHPNRSAQTKKCPNDQGRGCEPNGAIHKDLLDLQRRNGAESVPNRPRTLVYARLRRPLLRSDPQIHCEWHHSIQP